MAQYAISVVVAGVVLSLLTDVPRDGEFHFDAGDLPAIMLAALVFFIVNTSLVAAVIAMVERVGIWRYLVTRLALAGVDDRPDARPLADPRAGRRLLAAAGRAAVPAAVRDPSRRPRTRSPRSTRRSTTRSPGCRTACCSATASTQAIPSRPPQRPAAARDADGPRPLQGDQRHARPPPGRPAPAGGRGAAAHRAARERHGRPAGRRRVRRPAPRRRGPGRPRPSPSDLLARLREPFAVDATTLQVGGEHRHRAATPSTATTSRRCIQRADIAMYAAKATSERPRGVRGQPGPPQPAPAARSPPSCAARSSGSSSCSPTSRRSTCDRPDRRRRGARALGAPEPACSSRPSSSRSPSRPA